MVAAASGLTEPSLFLPVNSGRIGALPVAVAGWPVLLGGGTGSPFRLDWGVGGFRARVIILGRGVMTAVELCRVYGVKVCALEPVAEPAAAAISFSRSIVMCVRRRPAPGSIA